MDTYAADYFLRLAVKRLLEIVCEATRHISDDVKKREAGIPWQRIIDFGNRLRHAYHEIDAMIVWNVVQNDLTLLKAFVQRILKEETGT